MDVNKAVYWIAAGVLVLGLNSEYRHGGFASLHRVAQKTGSVLCRATTRGGNSRGCNRTTYSK